MSLRLFSADRRDTLSRKIAQGGLLASITVILTSLGNLLSLIEILQYLALTPIIIAGILRGTSFSIKVALASTLLIGMIWGFFPGALFFFISTVPLGVLLGYLFPRTRDMKNIIVVTVIILSLSITAILFLSIRFFAPNFNMEVASMARTCKVTPERFMHVFMMILPSIVFLTSLTYAFYIWLFNAFILGRLRILRSETSYFYEIFRFFRLPVSLVAVFVLSLGMLGAGRHIRNDMVLSIGMNLFGITSLLFFFTGMFNIRRFVHIKQSRLINLVIFLFCITIGLPITILTGIFITVKDAAERKGTRPPARS